MGGKREKSTCYRVPPRCALAIFWPAIHNALKGPSQEAAIDPERRVPREPRALRFVTGGGVTAVGIDLSALGLKVRSPRLPAGEGPIAGVLHFDDREQAAEVKVRVAWSAREGEEHLLGLEVVEADLAFYDALPFFHRPAEATRRP
jgi:PilZ domain